MVNEKGEIHCSLIFGKSCLAPIKSLTIPRLELCAAVVASQSDVAIHKELQVPELEAESVFWTDSATVLRYLNNESRAFHTFVANRVQKIKNVSSPAQWQHVPSKDNPADLLTRGLPVDEFLKCSFWKNGPNFLWQPPESWPKPLCSPGTPDFAEDPEVKKKNVRTYATSVKLESNFLEELCEKYSSWQKTKRICAWVIRFKNIWLGLDSANFKDSLGLDEIKEAENLIFRYLQHRHYKGELEKLLDDKMVPSSSPICKLDPQMLGGLLCVGGRLENAPLPLQSKHPVLLPKCRVSEFIIAELHHKLGHVGRQQVISALRETIWIVGVNAIARSVLSKCVKCRRIRGKALTQKMANLPEERLTPNQPPFSRVGVDCFGPFFVKQGRSKLKRYGVLFTCLVTRAVHIEVAHSLDTSSFINCLRRFVARRGQVSEIRSDNGSNFVGAERELTQAINNWNKSRINDFLVQRNVKWNFNVPRASHHGGVWERLIRSIRKVLSGLCKEQILTDESLATLLCEVESILNSRPLLHSFQMITGT